MREEVERKKGNKKRFESRKNRINVDSEDESIDQQTKEEKEEKEWSVSGKSECNEMRVSGTSKMGRCYGVENIFKLFVNTIWEVRRTNPARIVCLNEYMLHCMIFSSYVRERVLLR